MERWLCGVAASYGRWPRDRFTFRLQDIGRPVYVDHREDQITPAGFASASVGTARRFAEIPDLGVITLIEITSPGILRDLAQGKRSGLSIKAHLDPPPVGPQWTYIAEVSLTARPRDPLARVVSTGQLALGDWLTLTGQQVSP